MKHFVRFNLRAGAATFKHWQIKIGTEYFHYHPDEFCIAMQGCTLINKPAIASKVYAGNHRNVCGWVECEMAIAVPGQPEKVGDPIFYDPKVAPYWRNKDGENIDGIQCPKLITSGKQVYLLN
jgi:hypothetical protein